MRPTWSLTLRGWRNFNLVFVYDGQRCVDLKRPYGSYWRGAKGLEKTIEWKSDRAKRNLLEHRVDFRFCKMFDWCCVFVKSVPSSQLRIKIEFVYSTYEYERVSRTSLRARARAHNLQWKRRRLCQYWLVIVAPPHCHRMAKSFMFEQNDKSPVDSRAARHSAYLLEILGDGRHRSSDFQVESRLPASRCCSVIKKR